jgi:hypothetical protein
MGYYAVGSGSFLPTFRDNLSVPSHSWMGQMACPETSVWYYHYPLRNSPEERSSYLLKSVKKKVKFFSCQLCEGILGGWGRGGEDA